MFPIFSIILIVVGLFLLFLSIGAFSLAKKEKNNGNSKGYRNNMIAFVVLVGIGLGSTVGPIVGIINGSFDDSEYVSGSTQTGTSSSSSTRFTNKYGTSTTKCFVSGCDNYIAKSGDTNCCTTHSNRCGECNCYIDGDALFCMDCLEEALGG